MKNVIELVREMLEICLRLIRNMQQTLLNTCHRFAKKHLRDLLESCSELVSNMLETYLNCVVRNILETL